MNLQQQQGQATFPVTSSSNFEGKSRFIELQAAPTEQEPTPVTSSSNFEGKSCFIELQAAPTEQEPTPVTSSSKIFPTPA